MSRNHIVMYVVSGWIGRRCCSVRCLPSVLFRELLVWEVHEGEEGGYVGNGRAGQHISESVGSDSA